MQACLEEEEDRQAEASGKRRAQKLEAQALVLPGTLSSSDAQPDDDAAADATYTVNEAIDHMGTGEVNGLLNPCVIISARSEISK